MTDTNRLAGSQDIVEETAAIHLILSWNQTESGMNRFVKDRRFYLRQHVNVASNLTRTKCLLKTIETIPSSCNLTRPRLEQSKVNRKKRRREGAMSRVMSDKCEMFPLWFTGVSVSLISLDLTESVPCWNCPESCMWCAAEVSCLLDNLPLASQPRTINRAEFLTRGLFCRGWVEATHLSLSLVISRCIAPQL